jgi:hypothetical protein
MKRICAAVIAILGWLALLLQFVLHITNPLAPDVSFVELLVRFFSYFTILTNIIVAVTLTTIAFLPLTRIGRFLSRPSIQAANVVYITIVAIVYSIFLRGVWDPIGWNAIADHALHDVLPILYVANWLILAPKSGVSWIDPVKWLVYPAAYFAYSLLRGGVVGWYPYWFADVGLLGYPAALSNAAAVLLAFLITGFSYTGVAKLLSPAHGNTPLHH